MKDLPKCKCGGKPQILRVFDGYIIECGFCDYKTSVHKIHTEAEAEWCDHCAIKIMGDLKAIEYEGEPPRVVYSAQPVVGPMPKFIWLEHRCKELSEYLVREYSSEKPNHKLAWGHAVDLQNMIYELYKR